MKNIVILGAGFGGLRAALVIFRKLNKMGLDKRYQTILVDRNDYHTYTPTLYEIVTTAPETADYLDLKSIVTFPIEELIEDTGIKFIQSEVTNLDLINGDIHFKERPPLKFNYLIITLGSETNTFGIPGVKEYALELKSFNDALRIRDAVIGGLARRKMMKIVIGGGGSTGVELAGKLRKECSALVSIIDSGPSILNQFHPRVFGLATKRLKKLGVEIIAGESVQKVEKNRIILKSEKIVPYDIFIWTGGVRAPSLVSILPLKREKRGRIEVAGQLECLPQTENLALYGKIYAIGDSVCFYDPVTGKPILQVARAAIAQANVAAYNIYEDIKFEEGFVKKKRHKFYRPMEYPYIIPVGGKYAVCKLGPFVISGLPAWILKGLVELNYLVSIMPFRHALKIWFKGLKIFIQQVLPFDFVQGKSD